MYRNMTEILYSFLRAVSIHRFFFYKNIGEKDTGIGMAEKQQGKDGIFRAILADGKIVGNISVERKADVYRRDGEIGYMLKEEYYSRGIMTEAVRQICLLAYKELDLIRITGLVYEPNIPSRKVLEKNGFVLEGVMKKAVTKGDKVYDLCIYGKCIGE